MENLNITNVIQIDEYDKYLKDTNNGVDDTRRAKLSAANKLEKSIGHKNLAEIVPDDITNFREEVYNSTNKNTGEPLKLDSIISILSNAAEFVGWLIKKKYLIDENLVDYFNLSRDQKLTRDKSVRYHYHDYPTILKLFNSIDDSTEKGRRNKFLIAFLFLTGIRITAFLTLTLKCIDLEKREVYQHTSKGVKTKYRKSFESIIFNFDDDLLDYVYDYIKFLRLDKGFGDNDPVFPKLLSDFNNIETEFSPEILSNKPYNESSIIGKVLEEVSLNAKVEYYSAHTLRHSAIFYTLKCLTNSEELKAVSMHFGHDEIKVILISYANFVPEKVYEILMKMDFKINKKPEDTSIIDKFKMLSPENQKAMEPMIDNLLKKQKEAGRFV